LRAALLGPTWYRHCLRFALWGVWIVLGKREPVLHTLSRLSDR
jgi:hypothetical protein